MVKAYLAFGSNLGNKIEYIKAAYDELERSDDISMIKKSSFYFSKAYGGDDLNDFVNSVALVETALSPMELLEFVKNIEMNFGRKKTDTKKYENRQIDIDILFYGGDRILDKKLTIPHNDIENRDFVLVPLKEIASDIILPSGKSIDEALNLINNTTRMITDD